MLEIVQIPVLSDNYIYLLHDALSSETAVVDPALAEPVLNILQQRSWSLTYLLNTHHHWDHVGGNEELKQKTGCTIFGPKTDQHRIPAIDVTLSENDTVSLGSHSARIIETPGHTHGHIVYHFNQDNALFCGDTLFVMGCGRLFEGTALQMYDSLSKLKQLPGDTRVYCAHEYSLSNANFAMTVDPDNQDLQETLSKIQRLRDRHQPTVPSTIARERLTNPFFRSDSQAIKNKLNMHNADPVEVFAQTRLLKDKY